jgi:NADH:ubiquinone oxidoreductase subunit 4 (subunit M)
VLDFVLFSKLVRPNSASHLVFVHQTEILPTASFRFHLTMDTLAVQLVVPTTKPTADFHRQVTAHAGRTKNKTEVYPGFIFYMNTSG